jgi:hypothetical protein
VLIAGHQVDHLFFGVDVAIGDEQACRSLSAVAGVVIKVMMIGHGQGRNLRDVPRNLFFAIIIQRPCRNCDLGCVSVT